MLTELKIYISTNYFSNTQVIIQVYYFFVKNFDFSLNNYFNFLYINQCSKITVE